MDLINGGDRWKPFFESVLQIQVYPPSKMSPLENIRCMKQEEEKELIADHQYVLQDDDFARQVQEYLTPFHLPGLCQRRFGSWEASGYVLIEEGLDQIEVIYSVGVGAIDEVALDVDLLDRYSNVKVVRAYDPTLTELDVPKLPRMEFHKIGLGGFDHQNIQSLESMLRSNGDKGKRKILKVDCEGCEFQSFDMATAETLLEFDQITMELHWINAFAYDKVSDYANEGYTTQMQLRVLKKLSKLFYLHHIHAAEQVGLIPYKEGHEMSTLLEASYIRKDLVKSKVSKSKVQRPLFGLDHLGSHDLRHQFLLSVPFATYKSNRHYDPVRFLKPAQWPPLWKDNIDPNTYKIFIKQDTYQKVPYYRGEKFRISWDSPNLLVYSWCMPWYLGGPRIHSGFEMYSFEIKALEIQNPTNVPIEYRIEIIHAQEENQLD